MPKKKKETHAEPTVTQLTSQKPKPAFLQSDYPYQTVGEQILNVDEMPIEAVYEIKCPECEMSIRSQGQSIKIIFNNLINGTGCIGCGNKGLVVRRVGMKDKNNCQEKC